MPAFLIALIAIALGDQLLKAASARASGNGILVHHRNPTGATAALPTAAGAAGLAVAAAFVVATLILFDWPALMSVGLGLALGGAVSNFWDRARLDAVVDCIPLPGGRVVNLADLAIAGGTILGIVGMLLDGLG